MKRGDMCTCSSGILYRSRADDDDVASAVICSPIDWGTVICNIDVFIICETWVAPNKQRIHLLIGTDAVGWINEICCFDMNFAAHAI